MQRAGRRTHRIRFERIGTERDAWNEPVEDWQTAGASMAAVFFGTGAERRQAAMEQGSQSASFVVPSTATTRAVGVSDRLIFGGVAWNIRAAAPMGRHEIEFTAVRGSAPATPSPPANDVGVFDFSDPKNSALLAILDFGAVPAGSTMDFSEPANSGLVTVF